jgi:hypothetical protein
MQSLPERILVCWKLALAIHCERHNVEWNLYLLLDLCRRDASASSGAGRTHHATRPAPPLPYQTLS